MNKKQVGALLKVMGKDDNRPVLKTAYIDKYEGRIVLVATDGYKLACVYLDGDEGRPYQLVGRLIRRSAIEKWYKLATGKSRLTLEELEAVSADDYAQNGSYPEGNYPEWQKLVPTTEAEPISGIAINAEYMKTAQDLLGTSYVKIKFSSPMGPVLIDDETALIIIMPIKSN